MDAAQLAVLEDATPNPDVTELSSLSVLIEVPFKTVREWFQNRRQKAEDDRDRTADPLHTAMLSIFLREDNPSWNVRRVVQTASDILERHDPIDTYLDGCLNTFVMRGAAKTLVKDPTVGMEDAKTIAMCAFLQTLADVLDSDEDRA